MMPTQHPAIYFPIENDRYEVKPGLVSLHKDFGNGSQDRLIFQFDNTFSRYRHNKQLGRQEQLAKYFCTDKFTLKQQNIINQFIIKQLCEENPKYFVREKNKIEYVLSCSLTNDKIIYNHQTMEISNNLTQYESLFDALAMQVQEDIAVITLDPESNTKGDNRVTVLHLFSPNHWAATDKIGNSFTNIHQAVAGIEQINKNQSAILKAMINKGPYVRFAWGLSTDDRLNHHPVAADQQNPQYWQGRKFNPNTNRLYLRVERQTISGLPSIKSALFTIRTYFYVVAQLNSAHKISVVKALQSMTHEQLIYKGLLDDKDAIIQYLLH